MKRGILRSLVGAGLGASAFACIVLTCASPGQSQQAARPNVDAATFFRRKDVARNGEIVVSGRITDEYGRMLPDVNIEVVKHKLSEKDSPDDYEIERTIVNGAFQIVTHGFSSIDIYFQKEGWYPEKRSYRVILDPAVEQELYHRSVDPQASRYENVHVVLEKQGTLVELIRMPRKLRFYANGEVQPIHTDYIESTWDHQIVPDRLAQDSLRDGDVFVTAPVGPDGMIEVVELPFLANREPSQRIAGPMVRFPREVTVTLNSPEGGFHLFHPSDERPVSRQMKLAPPDGYQRSLIFGAEDLASTDAIHFYMFDGERYGRGVLVPQSCRVSKDRSELEIHIGLLMQPPNPKPEAGAQPDAVRDVTSVEARNLETGE